MEGFERQFTTLVDWYRYQNWKKVMFFCNYTNESYDAMINRWKGSEGPPKRSF